MQITQIDIAALTYYYFGLNISDRPIEGITPLPAIDYSQDDAIELAKERLQQYTAHKAYLQSAIFGLIEQDIISQLQDMATDCEDPKDLAAVTKILQTLKTDITKLAHTQDFDDLPAVIVRDLSGENRNTNQTAG